MVICRKPDYKEGSFFMLLFTKASTFTGGGFFVASPAEVGAEGIGQLGCLQGLTRHG